MTHFAPIPIVNLDQLDYNKNMTIINTYQAKTILSQLIDQTLKGQDVVIAKAGKPLVRLVPYVETQPSRKPGLLKNKIKIAADFDVLPTEFMQHFK